RHGRSGRVEARARALAEHGTTGLARAGARDTVRLRERCTDGLTGRRRRERPARAGSREVPGDDPEVRAGRLHTRLHPSDRRQPEGVLRVGSTESDDRLIPEPETIYERTKEEGKRRLTRPVVEEISTALAAGFDIVAGIILLAVLTSLLEHQFGKHAAHVVASMGFGVGFIFLIVGRGELFTENFLVPLAGLDHE